MSNSSPSDTTATSTDSHKNEGFLKSLWHKVTENPDHAKSEANEAPKDEKSTKKDDKENPK